MSAPGGLSFVDAVPDVAPKGIIIEITPRDLTPDVAPPVVRQIPQRLNHIQAAAHLNTRSSRPKRRPIGPRHANVSDQEFCLTFGIWVAMIGMIVGFPIFFASYLPLKQKFNRIEQVGPLSCNVTGISHSYVETGVTNCQKDMKRINYGLEVAIAYYNTTVYGTTGEIGSHCFYKVIEYDYRPDKAYLLSRYGAPRTCYLDPADTSDIYLDLTDIRATSKGVRWVFSLIFLILAGLGMFILLMAGCIPGIQHIRARCS